MLYKKNSTKSLDMELFKNPTSEYRGTPFWAWNCELKKDMLLRQIDVLKEMGFGGFHMHSRSGISTEYLGEEFMGLIKACRDKAKENGMLAWLYDEDRWSSGSAGGKVTKTKKFREKILTFSEAPVDFVDKERGTNEGLPYLLAVYDISLDADGLLESYKKIGEKDKAEGIKRYAYVETGEVRGWWNNQTYVDTLSKEAMQEFIKITYETYKDSVGEDFGDTVPAIFTDEPNFHKKERLKFAFDSETVKIPWTTDFADTYYAAYGEDILEKIPEIFWDKKNGLPSVTRYRYHDHVCERFTESFADQCGKWCNEHGIALTGHVLAEGYLESQTIYLGEAMRAYRGFGIPGIDMLCNRIELTTAKQTQSAVHQYDREAMLSELYGVTGWDFDFRGHKFQGDWQAALGVTVRVPHLSWVSMKGSAKRDYPASISYQSPWYKEYSYVEDHFARLNTVLTRGKPIVKVGVIHPIESFWLHYGVAQTSSDVCKRLEDNFAHITRWLLTSMIDFDFISESLLPDQLGEISDKLRVGAMEYDTIVVPGCETLRGTTLEALKAFKAKGGRVVFLGKAPKYIDAMPSDAGRKLYSECEAVEFEQIDIENALRGEKTCEILNDKGETARAYVHCLRQDGADRWFFMARCEQDLRKDNIEEEDLTIIFPDEYTPTLYNTLDATVFEPDFEIKNGKTYVYKRLYASDSLLLKLSPKTKSRNISEKSDKKAVKIVNFKENVQYERAEDNVYLLDMAEYSLDGGERQSKEEILIIDEKCRMLLGYPRADGRDAQPWVLGEEIIEHYVSLYFTVNSDIEIEKAYIAAEEATSIKLNGREIELAECGWFVDESIKKYLLGRIEKGENTLEVSVPIGKRTSIENLFLLGDFDVELRGCEKTIKAPSKAIGFGDLAVQGLPFYGGNLTYKTELEADGGDLLICVNRYRGAAVKVYLDGEERGIIAYSPYMLSIDGVTKGKHTLELECLGNRVNTFGALHASDYSTWIGPGKWYTNVEEMSKTEKEYDFDYSTKWSYEYVLKQTGILSSPIIIYRKNV